jgi:hypothetical protein
MDIKFVPKLRPLNFSNPKFSFLWVFQTIALAENATYIWFQGFTLS